MKTTPLTQVLRAEGARFTLVNGWERADFFAPEGFVETYSFRFNEVFDIVKAEVEAVQWGVGLAEVNGFNRYEISGADAHAFLNRMACGRVTRKAGRVGLVYMLNHRGCVKAEATIANLPASPSGPARIWYGSAAGSEFHDRDWLEAHIGPGEEVQVRTLTNDWTILVLAGPKSRAVLSAVSPEDWSARAFPWLSVRTARIGAAPAVVMAVSFSGELAYEIHIPNADLMAAYSALRGAGEAHGLRLFGARAINAMRLEKGFLHWKADLLTEFDPFEAGLGRFVDMSKDFFGRAALAARTQKKRLVTLEIGCRHAPAQGGASVTGDGRVVGTVTSGGWGHRVGRNLAFAYVDAGLPGDDPDLSVDILGAPVEARQTERCLYDPGMTRCRS